MSKQYDFSDVEDYIAYFEMLAKSHKDIQHTEENPRFTAFDIWQYEEGQKLSIKYPALLLAHEDGNLVDKKSDNVIDNIDASFMVIDHVQYSNFQKEREVLARTKRICKDILVRMREDKADFVIKGFDMDQIEYAKIGPVFSQKFGYQFTFTIQAPINIKYDESIWL